MTARTIDGKAHAGRRLRLLRERVAQLTAAGTRPCLVAVSVGEDPAWRSYQKSQRRSCESVGVAYRSDELPADARQEDLAEHLEALGGDAEVHGILLQSPLPEPLNTFAAQRLIAPSKDVEAVNPANLGLVLGDRAQAVPCTAQAAVDLAVEALGDLRGVDAVVVGASVIVGRPVAQLLLSRGATVDVCHIDTRDLADHTRRADLLIVAAGKPGLITPALVKPGAVVIDVGINRVAGRVVGDVAPEVAEVAGRITPVPGGVGPVTAVVLLEATVAATEAAREEPAVLPAAAVTRLLGDAGVHLPAEAAARVARLLAQHLVRIPGTGPMTSPFARRLGRRVMLLDGAVGTELMARGVAGPLLERANHQRPDDVLAVHRAYVEAGAQAITTNTFRCNRFSADGRDEACALAQAGVRLARQAATSQAFVLGSIGPLGPVVGVEITAEQAADAAGEVALVMADAGVDGILLETLPSTREAAALLRGVRAVTDVPVLVCRAFHRDDDQEVAEFAQAMAAGGAAAVGVNCVGGPRHVRPLVQRLCATTRLPVIVLPNAGYPTLVAGRATYHLGERYFADQCTAFVDTGAAVVGGCCGIGPRHIAAAAPRVANRTVPTTSITATHQPAQGDPPLPTHPLLSSVAAGRFPVLALAPGHLAPAEACRALAELGAEGVEAVGLLAGWPGADSPGPSGRVVARLRQLQDASQRPAVLELPATLPVPQAEAALLNACLLGIELVLIDSGVFVGLSGQTGIGAGVEGLLALINSLNAGRDARGVRLEERTRFTVGVRLDGAGLGDTGAWASAGASFVAMAPIYERHAFRSAMARYDGVLPCFAEVLVLPDRETAVALDNELPAIRIPERLVDRLADDPGEDVRGVLRFVGHWRSRLSGLVLILPDGRTGPARGILAGLHG